MRIDGAEKQITVHHKNQSHTNDSLKKQTVDSTEVPKKVTKEDVEGLVDELNEFIDPLQTSLQFKLHEDLNEYYVVVVNPITQEVIKEIPPKKMLDMYAAMATYMGILIDKKI